MEADAATLKRALMNFSLERKMPASKQQRNRANVGKVNNTRVGELKWERGERAMWGMVENRKEKGRILGCPAQKLKAVMCST